MICIYESNTTDFSTNGLGSHIFYDLTDNMVKFLKPAAKTTGSAAVQALSSACLTSKLKETDAGQQLRRMARGK